MPPSSKLVAVFVAATAVTCAVAAADADAAPPAAGAYVFGLPTSGFTVTAARTSVAKLHFRFTVAQADGADCWSETLPAGSLTISVATALKLHTARRGGVTSYIVGRSTPKTSSGVTPIPVTFSLSTGGTAKGTLDLVFSADKPSTGEGGITIADCTFAPFFHRR
jgi:hypothetical protein